MSQETILTLLEQDAEASRPSSSQSRRPLSPACKKPRSCIQQNPPVGACRHCRAARLHHRRLTEAAAHDAAGPSTSQAGQGSTSDVIDLASLHAGPGLSADPFPMSSSTHASHATTSGAQTVAPKPQAVSGSMQQLQPKQLAALVRQPRSRAGAQF